MNAINQHTLTHANAPKEADKSPPSLADAYEAARTLSL